MEGKTFFFVGGGTGGHIYPAVAIVERMLELKSETEVHFFCSTRYIDSQILYQTGFSYKSLPAQGFSIRPVKLLFFCISFFESYKIAKRVLAESQNAVVVGIGGFVSVPACLAAHKIGVPIVLLNTDAVPGKANKAIAKWADRIFVQFEDTKQYFSVSSFQLKRGDGAANVAVVGCPLRSGFDNPQPEKAFEQLGLDRQKKILLITGASTGSKSINEAVCSLLENLSDFADQWQIVHLTGRLHFEDIQSRYIGAKIGHRVLDYFDNMPDLLSAADLVVGRSGAVSVAEYAAAGVPSICVPYPHHKDRHQRLNAAKLAEAGAAVILEDLPKKRDLSQQLWAELQELMKNEQKRRNMAESCKKVANTQAASQIAEQLLQMP